MAHPLTNSVRAELFAQLATLEKAGLPADQAWGLLKLTAVPVQTIQAVQKAVARGSNPALAAQYAGLFTPLEAQLVRAAMAGGSPAQIYQRLAESCAQRAQNESSIRARMLLPCAVLVLAVFIQGLPQLVGGSLSPGSYLMRATMPLLVIAGVALLGWRWLATSAAQASAIRWAWIGPAIARRNACNFFESLAWLLDAGVAMFEALPMAVATIDNGAMRQAYACVKPSMQRGATLSQALTQHITQPHFLGSPRVIEFIVTGEASGTLPEMLLRHTRLETQALALFWQQVAQWLPRLAYAAVACWMAYSLLSGGRSGLASAR
jgi:general secretion pathway protein F